MKTIDIAFVGSVSAGKTSLIRRCLGQGFEENSTHPTLGMEFHSTTIIIGKQTYKCNFVDSQGFDNNRGITMLPQYKRYHGFIVVYDVTDKSSFENSQNCFEEISENCQPEKQNVAFVGNKIDLEKQRKVSFTQANEYCLQREIYYVQTSALKNDQIRKLIERIAKNLICSGKIKEQGQSSASVSKTETQKLSIQDVNQAKNKGCFKRIIQFFVGIKNKIF